MMQHITYINPVSRSPSASDRHGYKAGCTVNVLINLDHISQVRHTEGNTFIEVLLLNGEWVTFPITFEEWVNQTTNTRSTSNPQIRLDVQG